MWALDFSRPARRVGRAHLSRRFPAGRPRFTGGGASPPGKKPLEAAAQATQAEGSAASSAKPAKPPKSRVVPVAITVGTAAAAGSIALLYQKWRADQQQAEMKKREAIRIEKKKQAAAILPPEPAFVAVEEEVPAATAADPAEAPVPAEDPALLEAAAEVAATAAAAAAETTEETLAKMAWSVTTGAEKRSQVRQGLQEALEVQDMGKVIEALATARACFLGADGEAQPSQDAGTSPGPGEFHPEELFGLSGEEAAIADKTEAANLGLEKLKRRIVELTGQLATVRFTHLDAVEAA
eukprot:CAMPEP_0179217422 /NCGR_PEP_ID=MMETSP0797-20121207/3912_1 /TAXON_ID=47934 /ORGANISM="Dinophysis acuminata, Strain DAEP01" /LENGTH=295 /DNA_ID=CAMNT_0020923663 /DNA_START=53 /DNA_END=937 /DNA_ORIENTATION=+